MAKVKEHMAKYAAKRQEMGGSPKAIAQRHLNGMNPSSSFNDIIYELYVLSEIEKGEQDFREGRVVSHEDVKKMLGRWLR